MRTTKATLTRASAAGSLALTFVLCYLNFYEPRMPQVLVQRPFHKLNLTHQDRL
jgi:hypothetical protein